MIKYEQEAMKLFYSFIAFFLEEKTMNLHQLITECPNTGLQLIAGKEGLEKRITWVHIMESIAMTRFLKGGELVLSTGVDLQNENNMLEFVKKIHSQEAIGVAFDMGGYILKIPSCVIDYCDTHGLPLFTIPKEVPFENIMRPFCKIIVESEAKQETISTAFKNAIFFPDSKELYMVPLLENHFEEEWRYSAIVLQLEQAYGNPYQRTETIITNLQSTLSHQYKNFALFPGSEGEIIVVYHSEHTEDVRTFVSDLLQQTKWILHRQEDLYIGVGKLTKSIRCLHKSYRQACSIMKLQKKDTIDKKQYMYKDMGVYRILLGIEDPTISQDYFDAVLGPLYHYDKEQGTDLVNTLRTYLHNNGSVQKTADQLFIHRNTVNYKINKASQILDLDFSTLNNRLELMLGFMLHDML